MLQTIPDALSADLRDFFLADFAPRTHVFQDDGVITVESFFTAAEEVRLRHEQEELPSPRLVVLAGDPQRVYGMDATARVPMSLEFVSSLDRLHPEKHRAIAGELEAWWRGIQAARRLEVVGTRAYLHNFFPMQPTHAIRTDEREQATTLRGDFVVTLVEPM